MFFEIHAKLLLLKLGFALTFLFLCADAKAVNYDEIHYLAKKCIQSRELSICKLALKKVEAYQEYASAMSRYACQTRLLGVQSDLIMVTLNAPNKKSSAFQMLAMANKACSKLSGY